MPPAAHPRPVPATAVAILALALGLAGGCVAQREPAIASPAERLLIDKITTDPYVEVMDLQRDARGFMVVTTRQGSTRVRYLLAAHGDQPLAIHRINEQVALRVADDGSTGTGPEPRGLR